MQAVLLSAALLSLVLSLPARALTTLDADGVTNPALLVAAALGDDNVETPDCSHPGFGPHLGQEVDATLGVPVFTFTLHVQPDTDRCLLNDRQRLEVKASDSSPEELRIRAGETVFYRWRFRLDEGFRNSPGFTHLHQLRPFDGDAAQPMLTLTSRFKGGDRLELSHVDSATRQHLLALAPFAPLRGAWVEAESRLRAGTQGNYTLRLRRLQDGAVLLHQSFPDLDLWRAGTTFVRPKWGVYRSLAFPDYLRDEVVRFTRFCIAKGRDECRPETEVAPPEFNPAGGSHGRPQQVSLSSATPGATLRYRRDGQLPDCNSGTVYTAPITVDSTGTLHAIACHAGLADSLGASARYTFVSPVALLLPRSAARASSNNDKAGNTLDGRLWTRWSANGDGQWIQYDLGKVQSLAGVDIAWYQGSDRRYRFELQASEDGVTFTPLLTAESSGSTRRREAYSLPTTRARWVRLIGHGNNADGSIALTETVWQVLP